MAQTTQMASGRRAGVVHWIDHFVTCTNDVERWAAFNERALGAVTCPDPRGMLRGIGVFQDVGPCRIGGFAMNVPLPPTRGIGAGLPRYGYYIDQADVNAHLKRFDDAGVIHGPATRTAAEGEPGVEIQWQDPDGNQFALWAPDVLPAGAMEHCSSARVGRISHAVFESRDLERTAGFFDRYCQVERVRNSEIAPDTLVLRLGAGARIVYRKTNELQGRTTGCGLRDAHTALLVHVDDYFPSYRRLWADLPEWDYNPIERTPIANPGALPARTVLHPTPWGIRFKENTGRGDDFLDWDTNMFHFYGGIPHGDSLVTYDGKSMEFYLQEWERVHGSLDSLKSVLTG